MISNMRIITKILIIGAILTSLVLIGTLKYYLTESENSRMNRELRDVFVASALNLGELYADGLQSEQALRNIILNPKDEKAAQNFEKAIVEFDKIYARALNVAKGSDIATRLEQSRTLWNQGLDVKRRIIELVQQGNSAGAVELLVKEETPKWRAFKDVVLQQQKK